METFSKSNNIKSEYSVSVVKIGELLPINNSDFLVKTLVNGFPCVVRKEEINEGDIMFYVPIECQLKGEFLKVNNLYEDKSMNDNNDIKGYFNNKSRVRIVRLRGEPSMGFLFGYDAMKLYLKQDFIMPEIGYEFDTVNDELFCKAYVPSKQKNRERTPSDKRHKLVKRYNRLIEGEFKFHYDTDQLEKNIHRLKPDDSINISVKMHGTSFIVSNTLVKEPKWGGLYKKIFCYLPNILQFTNTKYDYVYSSRNVIKNKDLNPKVGEGFFNYDIWSEIGELFKKYNLLNEGMTVYGEIVGYVGATPIQKDYDYGCNCNEYKIMPYRITEKVDGKVKEWNVTDVDDWTKSIMAIDELRNKFIPIIILYDGLAKDLYELSEDQHWQENFVEQLKTDESFYMEKNEPLCINKVPREGIVLRINDDIVPEAFKLKTMAFRFREAKEIDKGNIDIESEIGYGV